jgi:hypothetical protein
MKNITKGKMFENVVNEELLAYINNVENLIKNANCVNQIEGVLVGELVKSSIPILINQRNVSEIVAKHGKLDIHGLVLTINLPDRVVSIKGRNRGEVLNFIKFANDGFQIGSAVRINGYAIVTHFERNTGDSQTTRRTQNYLNSLLNRGSLLYSSGKTAVLPLITE